MYIDVHTYIYMCFIFTHMGPTLGSFEPRGRAFSLSSAFAEHESTRILDVEYEAKT